MLSRQTTVQQHLTPVNGLAVVSQSARASLSAGMPICLSVCPINSLIVCRSFVRSFVLLSDTKEEIYVTTNSTPLALSLTHSLTQLLCLQSTRGVQKPNRTLKSILTSTVSLFLYCISTKSSVIFFFCLPQRHPLCIKDCERKWKGAGEELSTRGLLCGTTTTTMMMGLTTGKKPSRTKMKKE